MPTKTSILQAFGTEALASSELPRFADRKGKTAPAHTSIETPGTPAKGEAPGNILETLGSIASAHKTKITSGYRAPINFGAGNASAHGDKRAADFSTHAMSREEGDALAADLKAKGFWVNDERDNWKEKNPKTGKQRGTGPHIHAEWRGEGGAPSDEAGPPTKPTRRSVADIFGNAGIAKASDKPTTVTSIPEVKPNGVVSGLAAWAKDQFGPAEDTKGEWSPFPKALRQPFFDKVEDAVEHIKSRYETNTGKLQPDDPRYNPSSLALNVDHPFTKPTLEDYKRVDPFIADRVAANDAKEKAKIEARGPAPTSLMEQLKSRNILDLILNDSLPANAIEWASGSEENGYRKLKDARKALGQEEIVKHPEKYPAALVQESKAAVDERNTSKTQTVINAWSSLQKAATENPGVFAGQLIQALVADPWMAAVPLGMGAKPIQAVQAVRGVSVASKAVKIADHLIDTATVGAISNVAVEAAAAGSEGREFTGKDALGTAAIGGGIGAIFGLFTKARGSVKELEAGNITQETLQDAIDSAAKADVVAENVVNDPSPVSNKLKHYFEEMAGVKFESDADLKTYLTSERTRWKKLFKERDLHGQYQESLANERMEYAKQSIADAKTAEAQEAAGTAKAAEVERAQKETQAARTQRFNDDYEAALAQREAASNADVHQKALAERDLRDAQSRLDKQDVMEAALEGDIPAVRNAMLRAAQRDAQLRVPKWQRGEIDPKLLTKLGIGSLFAGTAYAVADDDQKLGAAFAAGLAGLLIPGGGSVLRKMHQSGAVSLDGRLLDTAEYLIQEGKLTPTRDASQQMARDIEAIGRAKNGDQAAFTQIYEDHIPKLTRQLNNKLKGVKGRLGLDADDVALEVLSEAFEKIDNYKPTAPFSAYLSTIANRRAVDYIRKAFNEKDGAGVQTESMYNAFAHGDKTAPVDGLSGDKMGDAIRSDVDSAATTLDTPETMAIKDDVVKNLPSFIESLPKQQREAFLLNRAEEYTAADIAKMQNRPIGSVLSDIKRANDKFTDWAAKGYGAVREKGKVESKTPKKFDKDTSPFIGYLNKDGAYEGFLESAAKERDYHHSMLVKDLDIYDEGSSLKFVRMNGNPDFTIRGDAVLDPFERTSVPQISRLAKKLIDEGANPNVKFIIDEMGMSKLEAPYQNKSIGTLKEWADKTQGPRNQRGEVDATLARVLGTATVGALLGYAAVDNKDAQGNIRTDAAAPSKMLSALAGAGMGVLLFGGAAGRANIRKGTEYLYGASSTAILNRSKAIHRRILSTENAILTNTHKHLDQVTPFLVRVNQLPKEGADVLSRALMTGRSDVINKILAAFNDAELTTSYKAVRATLDSLGDKLVDLKRFSRGNIEYFPRVVTDKEGLFKAIGKQEATTIQGILDEANQKSFKKNGRPLSQTEESAIITQTLFTDRRGVQPGFTKNRGIEEITPELQQFYASPGESLNSYIRAAVQDIEAAKFFGEAAKNMKKGGHEYLDVDSSVKGLLADEIKSGKLGDEDGKVISDILRARFKEGMRSENETIRNIKNMGNIGLLGNFWSAATQLGDVPIQIFTQDLRSTLESVARQVTGKKLLDMRDFGMADHISEEFAGQLRSSRWVNKAFKLTLFAGVDKFGKNTALNAAVIRAQRLAQTESGQLKLANKYADAYGPEFPQLVSDLKAGKITDLTRDYAFMELSRTQPISRIEMPLAYLKHPNARSYLWLKSFTMKQIDVVRRDAFNEMKKGTPAGIAKGLSNLTQIAVIMGLAGAGTSVIQDFMHNGVAALTGGKQKDIDVTRGDLVMNMFKTYGFSQYTMDKAVGVSRQEARERRAAGEAYARPMKATPVNALFEGFVKPAFIQTMDSMFSGDQQKAMRLMVPGMGPYLAEQMRRAKEVEDAGVGNE